MNKNVKVLKILCIIILSVLCMSVVWADEEDDTPIQLDVTAAGIKAGGVTAQLKDVLLLGNNLYTNNSPDYQMESGKAGTTTKSVPLVEGKTGLPVLNGETVKSITLHAQLSHNPTEAEMKNIFSDMFNSNSERAQNVIDSMKNGNNGNLKTAPWVEIYGSDVYDITLNFNKDGTVSATFPKDFPAGLFAITGATLPDGTMIEFLSEYLDYFVANGIDPNDPLAPEDPDDPKDPDDPDDPKDNDEHRYAYKYDNTTDYIDMDPSASASISHPTYDVKTAIPTSEDATYTISAKQALYNIGVRATTVEAGVRDITIRLEATWSYRERVEYTKYKDGKPLIGNDGKVVKGHYYVRHSGTEYRTVQTDFKWSAGPYTYYDVPRSSIFPVSTGTVSATQGLNTLTSGPLSLTGTGTPGPQTLICWANKPAVPDVFTYKIGHYKNSSEARSYLNANDGSAARNRIISIVNSSVGVMGSVNYNYGDLHVTNGGSSGSPNIGLSSASTSKMIPKTYPNGTYDGSASVTYSNGPQSVGCNDVIVHTPVVNNADFSYISNFVNQKINIDKNRKYLILDGSFTITIPNKGTHNNYPGYGTREYNSNQAVPKEVTNWGEFEDVKLPFDAYLHVGGNEKFFIPKGTWLSESGAPISTARRIIYIYSSSMGRRKVLYR